MSEPQTEHELKPQEFEFESMHLQVGVRLQFITHRTLKPVQHFSTLIGWLKDEYLIVKMPMDSGAPIALVEGERVTIRVFSGIHVCSFASTVERVFGRPLSYVHIASSVSGISRLSKSANFPPIAATDFGAFSFSTHWMRSR